MSHESLASDTVAVGASDLAIKQGFEPLSTNTRVLFKLAVYFVILAILLNWMLWALLLHYLGVNRPGDAARAVAPMLDVLPASPLEPMPLHMELDWQDMVHQRQGDNLTFHRMGWKINYGTSEAVIPKAVAAAIIARYGGNKVTEADAGNQFPPPFAPVKIGADTTLVAASQFPPVGTAADANQMAESIYRPPTGMPSIYDLKTQQGPPKMWNDPNAVPNKK